MEISIQDIAQNAGMQVRAKKASDIIATHGENTIVLFEIGDTYETYNDNAEQVHTICKFPIIHYGKLPYLDFKKSCEDWVFPKLVREGFKICIFQKGTF